MHLIDIHTHVYPPAIARKAAASIRDFYQLGTEEMDDTTDTLLQMGNEAGIDRFVILPVAVRPDRTRHINDFILEQLKEQPRFIGFGTVHAEMENIGEEAAYILDMGLKGIKIHPDTQGFSIDDPRLFPVYEAISGKIPMISSRHWQKSSPGNWTISKKTGTSWSKTIRVFPIAAAANC